MTDNKTPTSVQLLMLKNKIAMIRVTSLESVDLKAAFFALPTYDGRDVCTSCGTETTPDVDLNIELFVNIAKLPEGLRKTIRSELGFQFDNEMEAKFLMEDEKGDS